ncbi:type II toxin-antitoxin system RelE/ParE family toxin [Candidatus Saccharibacteria bacterium]|nr:type II toxin-antitoxin system RelE/ParE family toxin [Candidatus Saccharibacteria bacterium]
MDLYEINFTETAIYNLEEIFTYISIELEDVLVAEKVVRDIIRKCYRLTLFPEAHTVRFEIESKKMRVIRSGKYVIAYSTNKKSRTVDIEYIAHSRRNVI